ncbi:SMP-30/gluconolactonase/LRE family protein [Catenulispora sp. GP43]|uniref:SMP-30/gluconolactonase/LRE family protein n=1 Tax=Catenulispora sp. GP43 TaxID=3156263 RepID=UPI003511E2B8
MRWTPPPNPHQVRRRGDTPTLTGLRRIPLPGAGPEHIAVDASGTLFTGLADGRILRVTPDGQTQAVADTGGRPLGLELLGEDALVVCDAYRGLLEVRRSDGTVKVLAAEVAGEPLIFCSNAAVAADGSIYFTQSSRHFNIDQYRGDLFEHSTTGRLFRYRDGVVDLVADGFAFANGIVLIEDGAAAVVAETGGYCLTRVELEGPDAGRTAPFGAPLPGFPDNLTRDAEGLIWVAMVSPRDPALDWLLPRHPRLRSLVWATPERLQPGEKDLAWAIAVGPDGAKAREVRGWGVGYKAVTAVRRSGETLYMGSLTEAAIAVIELGDAA